MKICFPFIAQAHQTFHALPIALELSRRHKDAEVHIAAATPAHLAFVKKLARQYYPDARPIFEMLSLPRWVRDSIPRWGQGIAPKLLSLFCNLRYFSGFDALVVPERTTLLLKRFLKKPRFIWTRHGAGDRASGFQKDIGQFDFVLMSGGKIEKRLLEEHLVEEGHYATGIYAKFDLIRRMKREPLFSNGRPTVVYNPHFWLSLSSWPAWGQQVLDHFARSDRYNLVFAPHIRLFYPPRPDKYAPFARFDRLPHMRIDLGSVASADMTYTMGADLYLGDVSSQAAEFLIRPRPCLFLNAHGADWRGDPNYRFWDMGPVIDHVNDLEAGLEEAFSTHERYRQRQIDYIRDTFGAADKPTGPVAADAIMRFLKAEAAQPAAMAPNIGQSAPASPAHASASS
ncbi:hypothetical protein IC614_00565 [Allosphingosinicella flava]|uniref:Glycosyl transferase n=1 Tax=Allosphingosinicella flava TaxID=2771430 RepID=A0A7T2GJR8_9SPHN|nr:hypothetical protein [Sphingosinicella flava]QPQ55152.1 hypothetical protein IC614_00565 [Sphingosinicella flava]